MPYWLGPKSHQPCPQHGLFNQHSAVNKLGHYRVKHTRCCVQDLMLSAAILGLNLGPGERKGDGWEKGERKKNQWDPQLHSWLKKLKLAASFHFEEALFGPFLFSTNCTCLNKASVCLSQSTDTVPARFPSSLLASYVAPPVEEPTTLWLARHALLALTSEEDAC